MGRTVETKQILSFIFVNDPPPPDNIEGLMISQTVGLNNSDTI